MSRTTVSPSDFDSLNEFLDAVDEASDTDPVRWRDHGVEPYQQSDPESDIGITNWNGVMQIWGDDYPEILYPEEIASDESVRDKPYSVRRGENA